MELQFTVMHGFKNSEWPAHNHETYDDQLEAEKALLEVKKWHKEDDCYLLAHKAGEQPWWGTEVEEGPENTCTGAVECDKPERQLLDLIHGFVAIWMALGEELVKMGIIEENTRHRETMLFLEWHKYLYSM